jgi:DNA-binding beta-propeller fold protein YncE
VPGRSLVVSICAVALLGAGSVRPAAARPWTQEPQWVATYGEPGHLRDGASAMAVAPDGSSVFVTGSRATQTSDWSDFGTVAYDTVTGAPLWDARYDGPAGADDAALDVAASPDGSRVYVTGLSDGDDFQDRWATVAYDAHTGAELWVARVETAPRFLIYGPQKLGVSHDGSMVFVTGSGPTPDGDVAWVTLAYEALTGRQRWVSYASFATGFPADLAVSPDGSRVYVTSAAGQHGYEDVIVIAFDASTGRREAVARYSTPGRAQDVAYAIGVSPDGSRVFVTGEGAAQYLTLAYSADLSSRLWASAYRGPDGTTDVAHALAVSPDGTVVAVTGYSTGIQGRIEYGTVAYDAATGDLRWVARFGPAAGGDARDIVYRPDGAAVYVTGATSNDRTGNDYVTVSYDAGTGRRLGVERLDGPIHKNDSAVAMAASPLGTQVFVTGSIDDDQSEDPPVDYATVAYATG